MKLGIRKKIIFIICVLFFSGKICAEDTVQVVPLLDLENLLPTFEEDKQVLEQDEVIQKKSNKKQSKNKFKKKNNKIFANLKALDKITARTSLIKIEIGEKKNFGKLEIKPLKCSLTSSSGVDDNVAYIQVKDLSSKNNNQVFIYNGWIFSSSPTLRSIDHPIYDLWLVNCENV